MAIVTRGCPGETAVILEIEDVSLETVEDENSETVETAVIHEIEDAMSETEAGTGETSLSGMSTGEMLITESEPGQDEMATRMEIDGGTETEMIAIETAVEEMIGIEEAVEEMIVIETAIEAEEVLVTGMQGVGAGVTAEAAEMVPRKTRRRHRRQMKGLLCHQAMDLLCQQRSSQHSQRQRVLGSRSGVSSHLRARSQASQTGSKTSLCLQHLLSDQLSRRLEKGKGE